MNGRRESKEVHYEWRENSRPALEDNQPAEQAAQPQCADSLRAGQRHERRDGHPRELFQRTTQRPDEQEQLVVGNAPTPQLDLRDHGPLHIPAEELKLPRQVRLRPSPLLPRTAEKKSQRVALRWLFGASRTCHFRHLTLATEQPLIGCHYWHIRNPQYDEIWRPQPRQALCQARRCPTGPALVLTSNGHGVVNADESVNTWEVLPSFGFKPDAEVYSDIRPGLRLEHGHLELNASFTTNKCFEKVVWFTGVLNTGYALAEISFEIPPVMPSPAMCAAWLAWSLRKTTGERGLGVPPPGWLEEGLQNIRLLPHEQERERREQERERDQRAYAARSRCIVARDWLRLARTAFTAQIEAIPDDAAVCFTFDGEVLTIRCREQVAATAADGEAWPQRYAIRAAQFRTLKRTRFMDDPMEISVWKSALHVGRWSAQLFD
jgi:hypothetical protein